MHASRLSNRAAYYNEIDPFAAQWLRNLIAAGHLPPGDVDERSICDVSPDDLRGYRQAHFFAGVGGWPLALRMAGIPDDAPIWTGSCPCQPFSAAGNQKGREDERHLWPIFARLIAAKRPEYVFGEQVATAIAHGWADDLQTDLEAEGYAVGYVVLGAHSVGAPHIRQRLYWGGRLADAARFRGVACRETGRDGTQGPNGTGGSRFPCSVADADSRQRHGIAGGEGCFGDGQAPGRIESDGQFEPSCEIVGMADAVRQQQHRRGDAGSGRRAEFADGGAVGGLGHTNSTGLERRGLRDGECTDQCSTRAASMAFWSGSRHHLCRDGKARLVEPGVFPLAHGVSARVGKLRAAGNAIVPQVGAAFVLAMIEATQ